MPKFFVIHAKYTDRLFLFSRGKRWQNQKTVKVIVADKGLEWNDSKVCWVEERDPTFKYQTRKLLRTRNKITSRFVIEESFACRDKAFAVNSNDLWENLCLQMLCPYVSIVVFTKIRKLFNHKS